MQGKFTTLNKRAPAQKLDLRVNRVEIFDCSNFAQISCSRLIELGDFSFWNIHSLTDIQFLNRIQSLKWNLEDGVIFKLYENTDGSGMQVSFSGSGTVPSLSEMNGKMSAWGWFPAETFEEDFVKL